VSASGAGRVALGYAVVLAVLWLCTTARAPVSPVPPGPSLYDQEGTPDDGYPEVNAAGKGPTGTVNDSYTNWKYQYGSAMWSAVYAGESGWIAIGGEEPPRLRIEADIEVQMTACGFSTSTGEQAVGLGMLLESNTGSYVAIERPESRPRTRGGAAVARSSSPSEGDTVPALGTNDGPSRPPDFELPGRFGGVSAWLVAGGRPGRYRLAWDLDGLEKTNDADPGKSPALMVTVGAIL